MRQVVALAWIALAVAACTGPTAPTSSIPADMLVVDAGEQVQARPPTEAFAVAHSRAMVLAEVNGDDLGYPWIDPASGELVLSVVTPRGRELVDAAGIAVPHRIREVAHGAAELRWIQDDVTYLHARGVPDSELIYSTSPDHRDNRTLIVMSAMSPVLLEYLAAHYPGDAIAIKIDPSGAGGGTLGDASDFPVA